MLCYGLPTISDWGYCVHGGPGPKLRALSYLRASHYIMPILEYTVHNLFLVINVALRELPEIPVHSQFIHDQRVASPWSVQ